MKKNIIFLLVLSLTVMFIVACSNPSSESESSPTGSFPDRDINGIVQWGAGGGTDSLMRPLAALAEEILGKNIIVQNKAGATGAIATQYVHEQAADGYTLLMGAENPQLYTMLGISELTYEDFEPVFLIGDERVGIVVAKDSKYKTFTELINAALENPGEVSISTTGTGGMPWSVSSFIRAVTGAEFLQIPFDSDAAALSAVLGGHADFTVAKVQSGIQSYKAGEINYLTLMSLDKVDVLPEVPLIIEEYPEFEAYLPWGPFYGIFVKDGTPQEAIDVMAQAFSEAFDDATYQELLKGFNVTTLGLTGDEAKEFLTNWQRNTAEVFYKSGAINKSPEELGLN